MGSGATAGVFEWHRQDCVQPAGVACRLIIPLDPGRRRGVARPEEQEYVASRDCSLIWGWNEVSSEGGQVLAAIPFEADFPRCHVYTVAGQPHRDRCADVPARVVLRRHVHHDTVVRLTQRSKFFLRGLARRFDVGGERCGEALTGRALSRCRRTKPDGLRHLHRLGRAWPIGKDDAGVRWFDFLLAPGSPQPTEMVGCAAQHAHGGGTRLVIPPPSSLTW